MTEIREKQAPSWPTPKSCALSEPGLVFHCGLGPGDAVGHDRVQSREVLRSLKKIANQMQRRLKDKSEISAQEMSLGTLELLEEEPRFNAGKGAKLQRDGRARLSAAVMCGWEQRMAGVSNLEACIHPGQIAASLLNQHDRCLTGFLATQYAKSLGVGFESPETPDRLREWAQKKEGQSGTVGCVSLDQSGKLFASTSTGGRGFERPGRVSDSCTPAGNFANRFGAVSCTGVGEDILDSGLAVAVLTRLEDGMSLQESCLRSFARFPHKKFGMIGLDRNSHIIIHATKGTLGFGIVTRNKTFVGLTANDWVKFGEKY